MKKILVTFVLVSSLVFSLAAGVMANSIYLDSAVGSTWKLGDSGDNIHNDLSGITLGGDYSFDKFTVGFEYTSGTEKDGAGIRNIYTGELVGFIDVDYNTTQLKGGYNFLNTDQYNLAATLGYYVSSYNDDYKTKLNAILLGCDGAYKINEKNLIQGSLGYSFSGQIKMNGQRDIDVTTILANFKYTYLFTNNLGASIGYRYTNSKLDVNGDPKQEQYGPTVGVTYKFQTFR